MERILSSLNFQNLSISEVDGLLDPEECDLLVAIAKGKSMKSIRQHFSPLKTNGGAEKLLRDWDYDQDGFISYDEVCFLSFHKGLSPLNTYRLFRLKLRKKGDWFQLCHGRMTSKFLKSLY